MAALGDATSSLVDDATSAFADHLLEVLGYRGSDAECAARERIEDAILPLVVACATAEDRAARRDHEWRLAHLDQIAADERRVRDRVRDTFGGILKSELTDEVERLRAEVDELREVATRAIKALRKGHV